VALLLRKHGITRIRPLAGGFQAWLDRRLPVEPSTLEPAAAPAV
jgi:3-mercaptopyruvate sulfurtransferase SseA